MTSSNLDQLSKIGGAAQGGSAKPAGEREALDREHGQPREHDKPAGEGQSTQGMVGGLSNDERTDEDRAGGESTSKERP